MSYRQILYQLVFATKKREKALTNEHCEELYKYIWGTIKEKKGHLYRINGIEDHIHIACDLNPILSLSDFVKEIKVSSSIWMKKERDKFPVFDGWADSYGAFTYAFKDKDQLVNYVRNQKEHHKQIDFVNEYKLILEEHGIDYDERYILGY
jgi:putative transposase